MNVKESARDESLIIISFEHTVRERALNLDHTVVVSLGTVLNLSSELQWASG